MLELAYDSLPIQVVPLNIIKPFGFSFQENKIRRAGLDYHDLATVSTYENWDEFIQKNQNKSIAYLSAKGKQKLLGLLISYHLIT